MVRIGMPVVDAIRDIADATVAAPHHRFEADDV
jgi:hypothetical protein